MRLAFLDFEATGIDPKEARIIEYAVMLWDTELKQPLVIKTNLVVPQDDVPEEITNITGISQDMISKFGETLTEALRCLQFNLGYADYIVAHNGLFYDKPLFEKESERCGFPIPSTPWIDTLFDLPYPAHVKDRKLMHLAAAHEFINPMPHRALADVITVQKIFSKYDLDEVIKISKTPLITVRADVTFNNKDLARKRGYWWEPTQKAWLKRMREFYLESEITNSEFKVIVL